MCTDYTIQKHLFLTAFAAFNGEATEPEVLSEMERNSSERYSSPNLAKSPDTLDALFRKCVEDGFVERATPAAWRLTPKGSDAIAFIEANMLPKVA